ncbi:MAG TPA: alkene reductase [Bdellovibrionales bacterium]|jgi:N-ethylmaleimide reductase|nr:alkene reductase [Bdellovibrionales bacterium]
MKLFESFELGKMTLKNKFVMAPMTRSRAIGNIPNSLMVEYYDQRASAGLIITEGTSPSPNGLGYARIPGVFTKEQAQAWRHVTDAVHAKGGKIFIQLMHTGRIGHVANLPAGAQILGPSAIAAKGEMWTDTQGSQPHPTPKEMTVGEIEQTIQEFANASKLAVNEGGFDGVELHGANGYLIDQFLNPGSNKRKDIYGTDRTEFPFKVAQAVSQAIGAEKTGIRVSPYGTFNDVALFDGTDEFYADFARKLSSLKLAYIHVIDHGKGDVKRMIRENFKGPYILSTGYDIAKAEAHLKENLGDLVAFGKAFIGNPDFVEKTRKGLPLRDFDPSKLYTPGPEGYTDYV